MTSRRDDDTPRTPNDDAHAPDAAVRPPASHLGQLFRGVAAAAACDAAVTVPWLLIRPAVRPANIAAAIESLLLGVNMLVGYVGGRAAARAGLAHDDARAQWTMAWIVTGLSVLVEIVVHRVRPLAHVARPATQPAPASILLALCVSLAVSVLLVRFGFAMGTWAQARREGRVSEEDEAGVE
jgi:hypothetical protein